jgi:hypothetical protein
MCQKQKKQKEINELLDNVNNILLTLENIQVNNEDSRQLRQDALISTITIRDALVQLGLKENPCFAKATQGEKEGP